MSKIQMYSFSTPRTIFVAVKAALTGHLVLSTLHTNDAPSTVNRLMNLALEAGMQTLRQSAMNKLIQGVTSVEEVLCLTVDE